jgi:hypothetical protein
MASNDCGCGPGVVSVNVQTTNKAAVLSTHCLSSDYRIDFNGQATGDLNPVISTRADKIVWSPLPGDNVYSGAPCLTNKQDSTYQPIESASDWIQWFEKRVSGAYCAQSKSSCQWSYADNGVATIADGLTKCLGLTEASYMIVYNKDTKVAVSGGLGFEDVPCEEITRLVQDCVPLAPAAERPEFIYGIDIDNAKYAESGSKDERQANTKGSYRYKYEEKPQYELIATIPENTGNNRHLAASKGTRYTLRNTQFTRLAASPDYISQWDTATGRLISAAADGVWVTIEINVFCSIEYDPTSTDNDSINLHLGIAEYDSTGAAIFEYRLDSDHLYLTSGTRQTVGLHGTFSYFMQKTGHVLEPRVWYGGVFAGQIDLQIGSSRSYLSIETEETISYSAQFVAA